MAKFESVVFEGKKSLMLEYDDVVALGRVCAFWLEEHQGLVSGDDAITLERLLPLVDLLMLLMGIDDPIAKHSIIVRIHDGYSH